MRTAAILRPDAKGRVTLGDLAKGVSAFHVRVSKDRCLVLEPYVEIPAREKWLFDNPRAIKQVKRGLADAAAGRVARRGPFTQYVDADED